MPELPEVEVVRRGLDAHVVGATVDSVQVLHPRAVRRHEPGPRDLALQVTGQKVASVERRGKYMWLVLEPADLALVVHLGMSGQMLVQPPTVPDEKHLRIRAVLDNGADLRFVDQRTFGGWALAPLVEVDGDRLPLPVAHIARDPMDPRFDPDAVVAVLRTKHTEIKRALLDQTVVSGIGNIYADEALWRARIHGNRPTDALSRPKLRSALDAATEVMAEALGQGGTSFDALYVNVNGESGYFERSLNVYGRENEPCRRCGAPIRREKFMNRSSYSCPKCQPRPRTAR
ncbi:MULTISPECIES: bifunctional DNA-formamidopyrimidine glycosylase/DNA-(apurinic or apyrimidinic site) lyase [Rhodococcus]|uniref:Formamidopyrimidine-DNA glycosylase n=1 Tax=Rhodococcus rhodochrous TaxID=1829 RepID=A0AA47A908_RHORH|nr:MULTISPECIES: bifunctional DNA-formamidopyrimidine glycosylase/DNA-(apurinic or apyrimidinic site) lyase [Rhodococcus]AYA26025.1 bifunctional DNA-formamidopyrimidine glycosylase/DNA-(apurinic or apyrimidinic site) lyase [Rhodococcus rhodochrous]MCB8912092.1 bifunctional DNA-formamidopyrimidine glycosylase/DNA-(apurinic or apyrimidinic site) lyase [Rhodococcus rhodochrous]MCD2095498.1 bifunctional DNA-formamidopyrimidine glycosylase/DNA-(apurinic or apyrimidinic site) lyase [Rhodococcus rhodoc